MNLRPAVFLDRDGVLNEIVERDGQPGSPRSLAEFRLVPDLHSVRRLKEAGLHVFIITNQPDVARGHVEHDVLHAMLSEIRSRVPVDDHRVCVHEDADECTCRKPRPGMIVDLAQHWHVDLVHSYVIGDMWRDVEAAKAAGCMPILIRRPYNGSVEVEAEAESLAQAVDIVLTKVGGRA